MFPIFFGNWFVYPICIAFWAIFQSSDVSHLALGTHVSILDTIVLSCYLIIHRTSLASANVKF